MTKKSESSTSGHMISLSILLLALGGSCVVMYVFAPHRSTPMANFDFLPDFTPDKPVTALTVSKSAKAWSERVSESSKKSPGATTPLVTEPGQPSDQLNEAMRLVDLGNPNDARKILEDILAKNPNNEGALVELGMIYLIDYHDSKTARGYLEHALDINPDNRVVTSELVSIYDELGQAAEGSRFLQGLYEKHPENTSLALSLGQMHSAQGNLQEAIRYTKAGAESGDNLHALAELADMQSQAGQVQEAIETRHLRVEKARKEMEGGRYADNPEIGRQIYTDAQLDEAREYIKMGDRDTGERLIREAAAAYPDELAREQFIKQHLGRRL